MSKMELKKQLIQLLLSQIFLLAAIFVVAFSGVYVNDLITNSPADPPLNDLFLDNVSVKTSAFQIADLSIIILYGVFLVLMLFHKERILILTRQNLLIGTILVFRTSLVSVTTLPAPIYSECEPFVDLSRIEHLQDSWSFYLELTRLRCIFAWKILIGFGMPFLNQINICGDFMFSGHAALITLFCLSIRKYMPGHYWGLTTVTWILNIAGVLAILMAHQHYSINILVAIYLTVLLFKYQHFKYLLPHQQTHQGWIPGVRFLKDPFYADLPNKYDTLANLKHNALLFTQLRLKSASEENVV